MMLEESAVDSEQRKCLLDGCHVKFSVSPRGRERAFCCEYHKQKYYALKRKEEVDRLRFEHQKLISILTTPQRCKLKEWGFLI